VSPSDIEIGIVTPGSERSERSSKSGQEVKETFLELLPVDDVIIASILPLIPLQVSRRAFHGASQGFMVP
jgi:hypothetical protein